MTRPAMRRGPVPTGAGAGAGPALVARGGRAYPTARHRPERVWERWARVALGFLGLGLVHYGLAMGTGPVPTLAELSQQDGPLGGGWAGPVRRPAGRRSSRPGWSRGPGS